jgi:hypothetical protein
MQLANVRVRGKRPNDSVLPPAPTNHKYAHGPEPTFYSSGRISSVWSRRGPTPTALTCAPDSSSIVLM